MSIAPASDKQVKAPSVTAVPSESGMVMAKAIAYRIVDKDDGEFVVVATMRPGRIYRQGGFRTLTEAEAWVDGLRALMAACGAPVVRGDETQFDAITDTATKPKPKPAGKPNAEKLAPNEQCRRFIDAAQAAGASENLDDFRAALKRIARSKPAS